MPYVVLFHFWMFFSLLWDDTRVPEFQADLISSGQSIPCKLEDIRVGKQIALELHVANKLEEQIEIDRVEPSCGCTVATIDGDKTIDPQKGFTVKMSLRIEDPGIFEKPVFFYRKGTDSPLFAVKIQGNAHEQIQYKLPHSVELDPKTYTATVDLELKALFDDVRMDVSKIAVVGAAFEKFSVVSADATEILAKVSFRGNAKSPAEAQHMLRLAFSDKYGKHVRDLPILVRNVPPLRAAPRKLTLVKTDQTVSVSMALLGVFEKDKEMSIDIRHGDQVVGTVKTTPTSDRLVSVKFSLDEKSPIWQVPSGVLKFSTATESVEVPFVFQE
ncbi:MAG: DUF1573 domain-containing protein [Burkholderiaceae bacterium]|jgi:hypothetical protein